MLTYNDLYELLRKEKYSESLQPLPKRFLEEFKEYINDKVETTSTDSGLFSESVAKSKKQLENAIALFRELVLKRKRKILNLVFVATETGIMKRDYENMLPLEKTAFDKLVKIFEENDQELQRLLHNRQQKEEYGMILFTQNVAQFIDHHGDTIGPFKSGELANLETGIANIFVQEGKATIVDES